MHAAEIAPGGIAFVKGHGTENDFVLIPDRADMLEITAAQVRLVCDRHAGIGADGVIRIAPDAAGGFYMDYRNADGSLSEMCGNGARLFARYLVDVGWEQPGTFEFGTRGGRRTASVGVVGDVTIGMGPAMLGPETKLELGGKGFSGVSVDVGNPHLVTLLDAGFALDGLDLISAPAFDPRVFPDGVNVEWVVPLGLDHVRMRVHERGVGETRSCGTGTVAVASAYLASTGRSSGLVRVEVPGGTVQVEVAPEGCRLIGPAVLVASGVIDGPWWNSAL